MLSFCNRPSSWESDEAKGSSNHEAALDNTMKDEKTVTYELKFDAPKCSDKEIEECFDFNFKDELKGVDLEKDDTEYTFKKKDIDYNLISFHL